MSSYRKGARFERRVRKILESSGWFVGRQGKSAFPDLICLKRDIDKTTIMLAECKVNRSDITKEEREKLRKLSEELGCLGRFFYRTGRLVGWEGVDWKND